MNVIDVTSSLDKCPKARKLLNFVGGGAVFSQNQKESELKNYIICGHFDEKTMGVRYGKPLIMMAGTGNVAT